MKRGKLFAKIVYYLFTLSVGVLMAIFLPYFYMYYGESLSIVNSSLKSGDYASAMELVGGYFDKTPVLLSQDGNCEIVLFNAATLVYSDDEDAVDESQLHKSYAGFVFGADSYDINWSSGANNARLVVTDGDGNTHDVDILNYDSDGDGVADSNATHLQYGFFYIDLDEATTGGSISAITLLDKDGNVFAEFAVDLTYGEVFFDDVSAFVEEYNRDFSSDKLSQLDAEFLAKNENYAKSSTGVAQSSADKKSAVIVVVYFVSVYVIGDFLVGGRYILKFFRWLLFKVFKIKPKQRTPKYDEAFGHDYYSQVTFVLDVSAEENFSQSVEIRYTGQDGEEISFLLLKEQNYSVTKRVKAGTYLNLWVDLDRNNYALENLPSTLVVEGYQKAFKIKILRREEKRL